MGRAVQITTVITVHLMAVPLPLDNSSEDGWHLSAMLGK